MLLARKRITGKVTRSARSAVRRRAQSTSIPADQSSPRASRKASRSSRFCRGWRISRTARCWSDHLGWRMADAVRLPPGPTSTKIRSGSVSTMSSSSANLIVALIWRAHRAGSVACWADIQVPVIFLSNGVCGARSVRTRRNSSNSGSMGSIELEWKACDVRIRRAGTPCWASRSSSSLMASPAPDTTQLPGSLTAAISRPGGSCPAMSSGLSATASITPRGAACIAGPARIPVVIAVGEVEHAGQRGRHVLADAVPGQGCGLSHRNRPAPPARTRRRTGRAGHGRCGPGCAAALEHLGTQVDSELVAETRCAPVEVLGEDRLGVVEATRHCGVLGALTGKRKTTREPDSAALWIQWIRRRRRCRVRRLRSTRAACCSIVNDRGRPELLGWPAREGKRDVGQVRGVVGPPAVRPSRDRNARSASAVRADSNSTCGPGRLCRAGACGASSRTTCTLVPPTPNELTPARRTPSHSHGRYSVPT